ncbi:TIGR01777 family oxidoreductase [Acidisphaera sp. S103]|uniref:TIGR01777 family oxidoreductase n=1 Tax=Acidisphaera sp. S103 TaxID=1747223 RepID=UPI00131EC116|nr:TIGR01777 family oxidoreductase [Acidisphaera sp. S103]
MTAVLIMLTILGLVGWAIRQNVPIWQRNPMRQGDSAAPKTVLVTGATGFIGRALVRTLVARGDRVVALTRHPAKTRDLFGPLVEVVDRLDVLPAARRIDAIVNLAGEPLAGRWTAARKRRALASRLGVTEAVLTLVRRLETRPAVLINGDTVLTEASAPRRVFMSDLCRLWEERAEQATTLGVRVCSLRIGLVLGTDGGAMRPLALATRCGAGMVMGSGRQIVSWIHRDDLVGLTLLALDRSDMTGPINAVAPNPVSHRAFMRQLGSALHRPVLLSVPAPLLRLVMGEMAGLFLTSQRIVPAAAQAAGFAFAFPTIDQAFADLYGVSADTQGLAVYMNEACPVCRVEMEHYEGMRTEAACPIAFQRIGNDPTGLGTYGLTTEDLRRRLYVRDVDGRVFSGVDAFAALWRTLPRYRWASRLIGLPGVHAFSDMIYEGMCVPILAAWNRHRALWARS